MFLTKPILTRREPLKRATLRIKLHTPLIKLIKRTKCVIARHLAQLTKMQPKGYIKDIKWLGNPYRHTVLKCSMKMYLKVICCSCYTCLPQTAPAAAQTAQKMDAPGTGTESPPVAQRLLTNTWPKTRQQHKYTCKQEQTLRNSTTIHKKQNTKLV